MINILGETMAKLTKQELNKKIQTQNLIIVALAIIIFILMAVSGTAAWYIRTRSDSADIILSNPVNIYMTEITDVVDEAGQPIKKHTIKTDILDEYNTRVYPGDKIKLHLGMQLGSQEVESSNAYVRVKISISYEKIADGVPSGLEELASQNLLEYKDKPDETVWEKVDFNKFKIAKGETDEHDYWFVLKDTNSLGKTIAKVATNLQTFEFLDGYIALSKTEITNVHANCKFHINYMVEAIQVPNVPDPLYYEGYGPWWEFELGDIEDVEGGGI